MGISTVLDGRKIKIVVPKKQVSRRNVTERKIVCKEDIWDITLVIQLKKVRRNHENVIRK